MDAPAIQRSLDTLIDSQLRRTLAELAHEAGQPISAAVLAVEAREVIARREIKSPSTDAAQAEARVLLSHSLQPGVVKFSCQVLVRELEAGRGFSGFSMKGTIDVADPVQSVRVTSRINHYNQWTWANGYQVRGE